jgi:chromate transporter
VKFLVLLWILAKSTFTSFAGLASLPEIRSELVEERHWLSDDQLTQAIAVSRATPGPLGVYVVSVGYMADGVPGAVAGWLAMAAPSLLVIALVAYFGRRAQHPRVRSMLRCVVLASAALLVLAVIPLARNALDGPVPIAIAVLSLPVFFVKRIDSLWVVAGSALVSLGLALVGVTA